ncbi:MAG: hypothetical protein ACLFQV_04365 [Vulcanimicrobiota bacterium]
MRKLMSWLVVSVLFLFLCSSTFATEVIIPGERVGRMKIGISIDDVYQTLGQPEIDPIPEKEMDYFVYYDRHKMVIGVTITTQKVAEIAVYSPYYKLENEITISSTREEVEKVMGKGELKSDQGSELLIYAEHGIAFVLEEDEVIAIGVREKGFESINLLVPR